MTMNGKVTLRDVYDVVNRLEDKMDTRLKEIERCVEQNTNFRYKLLGCAGVIGAVAGGAVSVVWEKLTK